MKRSRKLIEQEIESLLEIIRDDEKSDEEKDRACDRLCKLYKLELDDISSNSENTHRIINTVLTGVGVFSTVAIGIVMSRWQVEFEETGSVTGKWYTRIGKLLPLVRKN